MVDLELIEIIVKCKKYVEKKYVEKKYLHFYELCYNVSIPPRFGFVPAGVY